MNAISSRYLSALKSAFIAIRWTSGFRLWLLVSGCLGTGVLFGQPPAVWESRGIGGGGAFFAPSFNPHDPGDMFVASDMGGFYRSQDYGASWTMYPFYSIRGNRDHVVRYTMNPDKLYVGGYRNSMSYRSLDNGVTWEEMGRCYSLYSDWDTPDRIFRSTWDELQISNDAGETWQTRFDANDGDAGLYVAGMYIEDDLIVACTNHGLLVSTNGGVSFEVDSSIGGIPLDETFLSFAAAKEGDLIRFFCITGASAYNGLTSEDRYMTNYSAEGSRGIYSLDWGVDTEWTRCDIGQINPEYPRAEVAMAANNVSVAYVTVENPSNGAPLIFKTSDGGTTWQQTLFPWNNNQNIETGWGGRQSRFQWFWGGRPMAIDVARNDADTVAFTDYFWVHLTTDGGVNWRQAYTSPSNPAGEPTPHDGWYSGIGLEDTSAWWLTWAGPEQPSKLFASFTDKGGIRSEDGGVHWTFDFSYAGQIGNTYQVLRHSNGGLYAATASVHDLYDGGGGWTSDERIDHQTGRIYHSTDGGFQWEMIWETKPVIWLCEDPNDPETLYASVVNHSDGLGGIWRITNLSAGLNSVKEQLNLPPRTEGHPLTIEVLTDGTLVASYSVRRTADGAFQPSSGVFVSQDGGATWLDRSDPGMYFWTKDLVVDPHDPTENTWYVSVNDGWGSEGAKDKGGLYKTQDRGESWERILDANVNSCTISPTDPNVMFVGTYNDGLWYSDTIRSATPGFERLDAFPFFSVMRIFFNPYDLELDEVWVTTFGNGLYRGTMQGVSSVPPDSAPDSLSGEALSHSRIQVQWRDTTSNESRFHIERWHNGSWLEVGQTFANQTSFTDTGLESPDTEYTYRVIAVSGGGTSPPSGPVSVTTLPLPPAPESPERFLSLANGIGQIQLSWSDPSNGSATFELQRSIDAAEWSVLANLPADSLSFTDSNPPANQLVYYRIRGAENDRVSPWAMTAARSLAGNHDQLVLALSFDEGAGNVAFDLSGAQNNGDIAGAVWVENGRFGKALQFDGIDDVVTIPSNDSFKEFPDGITIECWVYPTAASLDDPLVSMPWGDPFGLLANTWDEDSWYPGLGLRLREDGNPSSEYQTFTSPTTLVLNTWNHLAATYDGQSVKVYVGGILASETPQTGAIQSPWGLLQIGGVVGQDFFQGMLDEVRIYKTARTTEQIATDLQTATGLQPQNLSNWISVFWDDPSQSEAQLLANPDGDSYNNLHEYAFGGIPIIQDAVSPEFTITADNMTYRCIRRVSPELTYTLMTSTDLTTEWSMLSDEATVTVHSGLNFEEVIVEIPRTSTLDTWFMMMRIDVDVE